MNVETWRRAAAEYWPASVEHYWELLYFESDFRKPARDPYLALLIGTKETALQYPTLELFAIAATFGYIESSGRLEQRDALVNEATPTEIEPQVFEGRLAAVLSQLHVIPNEHLPSGEVRRSLQLFDSQALHGAVADVGGIYLAYFAENLESA